MGTIAFIYTPLFISKCVYSYLLLVLGYLSVVCFICIVYSVCICKTVALNGLFFVGLGMIYGV